MALILDERNYAETVLLKDKNFGNYLKLKDAIILAKYYRWIENKETREIKKILMIFCKQIDKNWNYVKQHWKIDVAIKESKRHKIRQPIPIPITKKELENINSLNNTNLERVAFIYLVYGKFLKYADTRVKLTTKPRQIGVCYTNEKSQVIFEKAGVNVKKSQRNEILHQLFSLGMLDATRWGGILLKYTDEDSPTEFIVENYDDISLYYRRWKGEQISICLCGRLFLKRNPNELFCLKCKQERIKNGKRKWWNKNKVLEKVSSSL